MNIDLEMHCWSWPNPQRLGLGAVSAETPIPETGASGRILLTGMAVATS